MKIRPALKGRNKILDHKPVLPLQGVAILNTRSDSQGGALGWHVAAPSGRDSRSKNFKNIHQGGFRYFENAAGLGSEEGIEGKYVIATSESGLSVLEVVAIYKDLSDVERGFRQLKDVLAMRPIYHQIETRVKAHVFVAALAILVQRLLGRRLEEAGIDFSAERAMEALKTVRLVTFRMDDRPEQRGVR